MPKPESERTEEAYWTSRLTKWVESSPVPAWQFYVLLFIALGLFSSLYMWLIRALPWGEFRSVILLTGFWAVEALAFNHYLMRASKTAFDDFAPLLQAGSDELARRRFEFSHLPRWPTLLWALAGTAFGVFMTTYQSNVMLTFERPILIEALSWIPSGLFLFEFIYRLIYQLGYVQRLYADIPELDILHMGSIHSLAGFSARAGVLILIFAYVNPSFLYAPNILSDPVFLAIGVSMSLLAIAAFSLPLLGIRGRLVSEKERVREEIAARIETARRKLQQGLDDENYAHVTEIRHAVRALLDLDAKVDSISVWPWSAGTLRGFLSAVLLPIFLWLLQQVLARALSF
jgi:hypothetical protein